jgi:hypothetical protein
LESLRAGKLLVERLSQNATVRFVRINTAQKNQMEMIVIGLAGVIEGRYRIW